MKQLGRIEIEGDKEQGKSWREIFLSLPLEKKEREKKGRKRKIDKERRRERETGTMNYHSSVKSNESM